MATTPLSARPPVPPRRKSAKYLPNHLLDEGRGAQVKRCTSMVLSSAPKQQNADNIKKEITKLSAKKLELSKPFYKNKCTSISSTIEQLEVKLKEEEGKKQVLDNELETLVKTYDKEKKNLQDLLHGQAKRKEDLAEELTKTRKELDIENKLLSVLRKDEQILNELLKEISKVYEEETTRSITSQQVLQANMENILSVIKSKPSLKDSEFDSTISNSILSSFEYSEDVSTQSDEEVEAEDYNLYYLE